MSNFNYCPVVWMFTSKSSLSKFGGIQNRALRFVLNEYTSDYFELLDKANVPGMKIMALRYLAIEVYKCINGINPKYLNDFFTIKERKNELRNVSITDRDKVQTTNHGLKSFKDYGAKIWNSLPNSCKSAISVEDFKVLMESWNGPNFFCSVYLLFSWLKCYIFIATALLPFLVYYILYHECPYDSKGNENDLLDNFMTEGFTYVYIMCAFISCACFYHCRTIASEKLMFFVESSRH